MDSDCGSVSSGETCQTVTEGSWVGVVRRCDSEVHTLVILQLSLFQ